MAHLGKYALNINELSYEKAIEKVTHKHNDK